jgi:predicted HAD superfamily Cof-like phosphohydrolase
VAEDWYADVMEFHRAMAPDLIGTMPKVPESAAADLRMALVCEEIVELEQAMERGDLPGVADAVADAIYVLLGLAVTFGIDMRPVWAAVHAANMAKVGGPRRADGKRLKPDGWQPPDIAAILARQPPLGIGPGAADESGNTDPFSDGHALGDCRVSRADGANADRIVASLSRTFDAKGGRMSLFRGSPVIADEVTLSSVWPVSLVRSSGWRRRRISGPDRFWIWTACRWA